MMIYRWQAGEIVPDATLEAQLGVMAHATIEDWLKETYPNAVLRVGQEYHSIQVHGYSNDRDESSLVDVNIGDYSMLIWCEHWGAMLTCYKWLVSLAEQEYRLSMATEADTYLDDLLYLDDDGPWKVAAKARLLAAGYTVDEVESLVRQHQERRRAELKRTKEARVGI